MKIIKMAIPFSRGGALILNSTDFPRNIPESSPEEVNFPGIFPNLPGKK